MSKYQTNTPPAGVHKPGSVTARILAELKKEPMGAIELSERLGVHIRTVRSALGALKDKTGGVVTVDDTRPLVYKLFAVEPKQWSKGKPSDDIRIAQTITIGRQMMGWTRTRGPW